MMIAIFDVGGPLITYVLLRDYAGLSTVLALVLSGTLPAFGVAITAIQYRRPDIFGVMVLIGILIGSVLGLATHNPRLYLAEGSVPSLAFSIACLVSLRMRQPLIDRDRAGLLESRAVHVRHRARRMDAGIRRAPQEDGDN
jgi:hypothetical protein